MDGSIRVADRDPGDAVRPGPLDPEVHGPSGENLADAVVPSSTTSGPESVTTVGRVTGSIAPLRSRAVYQGRRSIPCEECPHSSAVTRLSASRRASAAGTPTAARMPVPRVIRSWGATVRVAIAAPSP